MTKAKLVLAALVVMVLGGCVVGSDGERQFAPGDNYYRPGGRDTSD